MTPSTDALVVGCGPAGIAAARSLAERGARVVLVDRSLGPGGKACGGGLTRRAWPLARIDAARPLRGAETFARIRVRTALGEVALASEGAPLLVTIDRLSWAADEIAALKDLGVDVRLGERLVGIRGHTALLLGGPLGFGALVGADGAGSRVRRLLGLPRGLVVRAWQVRLPRGTRFSTAVTTDAPTIWFAPLHVGGGYAWAFPCQEEVRLGMGASERMVEAGALKREFLRWLAELGVDLGGRRLQCGSIACGYAGHRFGRIFLAGDAAGLASPMTGEGICQALLSGAEVAREIAEPGYRSAVIGELAVRHRRTHDALAAPVIRLLSAAAPLLLRIPAIRQETLDRYVL